MNDLREGLLRVDDLIEYVSGSCPITGELYVTNARIISILKMATSTSKEPRYVIEAGEERGAIYSTVISHEEVRKVIRYPKC